MLGIFIRTLCVYSEWIRDRIQRSEINIIQINYETLKAERKIWKENRKKEEKERKDGNEK
jgi:hypothetical protein